jgi:hypothetical protein
MLVHLSVVFFLFIWELTQLLQQKVIVSSIRTKLLEFFDLDVENLDFLFFSLMNLIFNSFFIFNPNLAFDSSQNASNHAEIHRWPKAMEWLFL